MRPETMKTGSPITALLVRFRAELTGCCVSLLLAIGCGNSVVTSNVDRTPPSAPVLTQVEPPSPANENAPTIRGTAEAMANVTIFIDAACSFSAFTGSVDESGSFSVALSVEDDSTTQFFATATDEAGNVSVCSSSTIEYVEDSTPPDSPSQLAITPTPPANENLPLVTGVTETDAAVTIYDDTGCTISVANGTADSAGGFAIDVPIGDDSTSDIHATATDAAGNISACSTMGVNYVEDSTSPATPTLDTVWPASPGAENNPVISGTAEVSSSVELFTDSACTNAAGNGSADTAGLFAITVSVADDSVSSWFATATDAAGNVGACSTTSPSYEHNEAPRLINLPAIEQCEDGNSFTYAVAAGDTTADAASLQLSEGTNSTCSFPGQNVSSTGSVTGTCSYTSGECVIEVIVSDGLESVAALLTVREPQFTRLDLVAARAWSTGVGPSSLAAGDLNDDGLADLAIANYDAGTVTLLFQSDVYPREMLPSTSLVVGALPSAVAVGDLNGDGLNDIAVADSGSDTVSILLQQISSPGSFLPATSYAVGTTPNSVAIGDLNGDARSDLAVANTDSNNISILMQDPATAGSFLTATSLTAGTAPAAVAIGELNNDARLDLAVANAGSNSISILMQDPATAGTFLTATSSAVGTSPSAVHLIDLNGDTFLDLAVTNSTSDDVSVILQVGSTPGTFAAAVNFATESSPGSLGSGDIDGDGLVDLVVANRWSHTVSVLHQDPSTPGSFLAAVRILAGFRPSGVVVADLSGDGRLDFAVTNNGSDDVFVFHQDDATPSALLVAVAIGVGDSPGGLAVADLNDDGLPDLAVANAVSRDITVLLQDAANPGKFLAPSTFAAGNNALGIEAGDLNNDGFPDLAVANFQADNLQLRFNDPTNLGSFPTDRVLGGIDGASDVAIDDLNGDGRMDLVVTSYYADLRVYLQHPTQDAAFWPPDIYTMTDPTMAPTTVDIDGDGRKDILVALGAANAVRLLLQDPANAGKFLPPTDLEAGDDPSGLAVGDLNRDGFPDIAVMNRGSDDVLVLLHDPANRGSFLAGTRYPVHEMPISITIADLNGDLRPDILTTAYYSGTLSVLLQDFASSGNFLPEVTFGISFNPGRVHASDIDGDGLLDVVTTAWNADAVTILFGR